MKKLILLLSAALSVYLITCPTPSDRISHEKRHDGLTPLHDLRKPARRLNVRQASSRGFSSVKVEKKIPAQKNSMTSPRQLANEDSGRAWRASLASERKHVQPVQVEEQSPWLSEISGETANTILVKKARKDDKCTSAECIGERGSINLVGVVVETERFAKKAERLVAGDVHFGDAKKLPVVYVK